MGKKDKKKRLRKIEIQEFTQILYCQYNHEGKKIHSLRDIAKAIKEKYDEDYSAMTIRNWAERFEWNNLNRKIKQEALQKVSKVEKRLKEKKKEEREQEGIEESDFTLEEQIIESESDNLAKDYQNASRLTEIGYDIIFKAYNNEQHETIHINLAKDLIKLGLDIKFRIKEIPQIEQEERKQIVGMIIK